MLQDLSNALETWDIDKKEEKLPGTAEEEHILAAIDKKIVVLRSYVCLLYTSPSPRDRQKSRMPSSA